MRSLFLSMIALATSGTPQEPSGPADPAPYLAAAQKVDVAKGRSINVVCMGSGDRTVLFDAGGSDWSVVWALVQPEIAKDARACAYDRAGLGYSDPAPGPRSPIAIVEDLHALVHAAGLARPLVLVGHSLGGFNVKLYAALYPEDVGGLVLVDPAEERSWDRTRDRMRNAFGTALASRAELLDQRFVASLVQRYRDCAETARMAPLDPASKSYRRCTDPPRARLGPMIAAARQSVQVTEAYQQAQATEIASSVYADTGSDRVYAQLFRPGMLGSKPVIVLTHQEDAADDPLDELSRVQGIALHEETARLSRRGVHRVIPGSGHYIELDQPAVVTTAVAEVLAKVRGQ